MKVYRATVSWDDRWFRLDGFYRTGHYHWGYEGDFFGLYREANYGANIDIYDARRPGRRRDRAASARCDGLKVAFGPQLWWGANPAVLVKYRRRVGSFDATGMYQEDIAKQSTVSSSVAVPQPPTRKATLELDDQPRARSALELGGIWSGGTQVRRRLPGRRRSPATATGVLQDHVMDADAFGGKAKVTVESGPLPLVRAGRRDGPGRRRRPDRDAHLHRLEPQGQRARATRRTSSPASPANTGNFQIGPNFLWQKPHRRADARRPCRRSPAGRATCSTIRSRCAATARPSAAS